MADQVTRHVTTACAVLHTDGEGNVIPCSGYPHAEAEVGPAAEALRLVPDRYGMRLAIGTPQDAIVPNP